MRRILVIALLLTLVACANENLASPAGELRDELRSLPGVTDAKLTYVEPVTLDSGKLELRVDLAEAASDDDVLAVVETTYEAFSTTHAREEGDLFLTRGDDTLHVRAFEPEASVAAVSAAALNGLTAPDDGQSIAIDLMTQDVTAGDHVRATYELELGANSTADEVVPAFTVLEGRYDSSPLVSWGVTAADGSGLSYDEGFPSADLRTRWSRLHDDELPLNLRAFSDGWVYASVIVDESLDLRDPGVRRELDRVAHRQIRGLMDLEWTYDAEQSGRNVVSIDRILCDSYGNSPWNRELLAWVERVTEPCVSE